MNNNGWIKIESENDLPKKDCNCWIVVNNEIKNGNYSLRKGRFFIIMYIDNVTHYQPIITPKPPLY